MICSAQAGSADPGLWPAILRAEVRGPSPKAPLRPLSSRLGGTQLPAAQRRLHSRSGRPILGADMVSGYHVPRHASQGVCCWTIPCAPRSC